MKKRVLLTASILALCTSSLPMMNVPVFSNMVCAAESSSSLLAAPQNIKYTLTGGNIILQWDEVAGAGSYAIYLYDRDKDVYKQYKTVKTTKYTFKSSKNSNSYKFKIAALVNQNGKYIKQEESSDLTVPLVMDKYWTKNSAAADSIREYVESVTDKNSSQFIPVKDRIAVFDLDGTLMCETYPRCFEYMVFTDYVLNNKDYEPTDEIKAVAQEILDTAWGEKPSGISTRQAQAGAIAYSGLTPDELKEYVKNFKSSEAEGFSNLTRGEAWYKPMLEMVDYLEENEFTVYIVTATERNIVRAIISDTLDIPPARVIGTEYGYKATGQGDVADTDYTYTSNDKVVFDGNYYGENAKMCKVDAIVREIGQQPVLAFGNSSGDQAMLEYAITNNKYKSRAYMVVADDEKREYGSEEKGSSTVKSCNEHNWVPISMKDDFATIYGDNVKRTH